MSIQSVVIQKVFVSAFFYNATFIENDYRVGVTDCFETVSDNNDSTTSYQGVNGSLYFHFILWVERGSHLVEQYDGSILQDGTSDTEALFLSS